MNKSTFYSLVILSVGILSSCASKTYEWVKINPDKIAMAKTAVPYFENVKYVEIRVNAKHKESNIRYVEDSSDYFAKADSESNAAVKISSKKALQKNKGNRHSQTVAKTSPHSVSKSEFQELQEIISDSDISMSKLNNSLIIPKKKKPAQKNIKENSIFPNLQKHPSTAGEGKVKGAKNSELKAAQDKPIPENKIKEDAAQRNSFKWIGLVLLVVGLIIGLIFGGMAYLISVVGIVFLVIGYFAKM